MKLQIKTLGVTLTSAAILNACRNGSQIDTASLSSNPGDLAKQSTYDVNKYPLDKLVCNPMGDEGAGAQNGLKAKLFYRKTGQARFYNVMDYINQGAASEQFLFYSSVNIPTRLFSKGFPTETGGKVKTDAGADLVEYFALQFKSNLRLDPAIDQEGVYQLAILSDDGAILNQLNTDGTKSILINSDGDHPTRTGCAVKTLDLKYGDSIPIELNYYQGPRTEIAAVMMWRKVASISVANDTSCGMQGQRTFFDYLNESKPQVAYTDLLARGWKPIAPTNYRINAPSTTVVTGRNGDPDFNPCMSGKVPVISKFMVEEVVPGKIKISWTTDILATSQARLVNIKSGQEVLSVSDNLLRTTHSVVVSNLAFNVNYMAQAVSISETFGKAISAGFNFQIAP
jgi:hypothetical protein